MKRLSLIRRHLFIRTSNASLRSTRLICTGFHGGSSDPQVSAATVDSLIAIFTKNRPTKADSEELQILAPLLTPKVVESALKQMKSWKIAWGFFDWASKQCGYTHNCYTYNAMAAILQRARRNAQMKVLAEDVVRSRCQITPGALGYFIRCLGNLGMVEEANSMFDQVRQLELCSPNGYSYNCLLETIAKSEKVELAEMRLREMSDSGWKLDRFTLTPLLQIYCNNGIYDKAMNVFDKMNELGCVDAHAVSILAMFFSKSGQIDKVFELIERMEARNIRLNEKTFCMLIHGFVIESRVDKALELFSKMKKSGFSPSIEQYDVLIGGLCSNKELDKALNLFLEMKDHGVAPDVRLLEKAISFFSEEEVVRLMDDVPDGTNSESATLRFNFILSYYTKNIMVDKAYHTLRTRMDDDSIDNVKGDKLIKNKETLLADSTSFRIVINGLLQAGKLDMALTLFREMGQIGFNRSIGLYNNLITALCDSNRLDEANLLIDEMKKSGLAPNQFTHNCIFGCLCRRQDVEAAKNMVKQMRLSGHEPWIKHSTLLIKRLCDNGRLTEACGFLTDMVEQGFVPDIVVYSATLRGLIRMSKLDDAIELFQGLRNRGRIPDIVAYNILISGLCKADRVSEADALFNEMQTLGLVPSIVTYNLMILGWCKKGDIVNARVCFSKMIEQKTEPSVVTYTTLVDGLCIAGRPDEAMTVWDEMRKKKCDPTDVAFMAIIYGLCNCGRPNEALQYLREMISKDMKPQTYVYVALLKAFVDKQRLDLALQMLKELGENGVLPCSGEKDYFALRDAIVKLAGNDETSSGIRDLIAAGTIPSIEVLDELSK